jgi:arsenate reductase
MPPQTFHVLFLCTGNTARSILAEGTLNHLPANGGRFRAFSAGSHPKGELNPFAVELLERQGIATTGMRSKSWDEFARPGSPALDFVITVCDQAAGEICPIWPGQPMTAHWGVADPAAVDGSAAERRRAFLEAYTILRRRIELFASLPLSTVSRLSLETQVRDLGAR